MPSPSGSAARAATPAAEFEHVGYREIAAVVLEWVRVGRFAPGDRIPTEAELCRSFGVARGTIRRALAQLVAGGVLEARQGAGTFVAESYTPPPVVPRVTLLGARREDWGPGVAYALIGERKLTGTPEDRRRFRLAGGAGFTEFAYLRTNAGVSVEYVTFMYPDWVVELIADRSEGVMLHLNAYLGERGIRTAKSHRIVTAAAADRTVAARLQLRPGAPVLRFEAVAVDERGRTYLKSVSYYRPEYFQVEFEVDIRPHANPAARLAAVTPLPMRRVHPTSRRST